MEISILMLTYNHKEYIRQALDGILNQKINVPYEILVLDDASTDGTQDILKEYKKRYPHLITLYLRKRNVYHPTRNFYFLSSKARGKYIATLEGDDFWIDTSKLQKQYDFLEKNKEFSACVTDLKVVDENNIEIQDMQVFDRKKNHIYTKEDFSHLRMPGMGVTLMPRNYFNEKEYAILQNADKNMGDITFFMILVFKNDIYQLDDKTAAYRYVSIDGRNNFNSINKNNKYKKYSILQYWIRMENHIKQNYDSTFEIILIRNAILEYSVLYSTQSMIHAILKSKNRVKYLLIYLIFKYVLDSNFISDKHIKSRYSWNKFLKSKYPIVLFGAGAVAEEYLDKYAWKGNIIFIVDNDTSRQNTSYKGYLVKNPDELLKFKDKVNVLITNKDNEKIIENQLKNMGIHQYCSYCSMQSKRVRNIIANAILNKVRHGSSHKMGNI